MEEQTKILKDTMLESVENEFEDFTRDMLSKTKQEIFDDYLIINFYNEIRNYLNDCELSDEQYQVLIQESKDGLIESLWGRYLKWDGVSVGSYGETEEFITEFINDVKESEGEM